MPDDLRMLLDTEREFYEEALACEAEAFGHWYGERPQDLRDSFAPWDGSTVFLVLVDGTGEVQACVRIVTPSPAGLVTLTDLGRPPWSVDPGRSARAAGLPLGTTWDAATLSTRRRPGAGRLSAMIFHGLTRAMLVNGATHLTAILETRVQRLMAGFGLRMTPLPGATTQPYYGSPASTPVHAALAPVLDRQRRQMPEVHRLLTLGVGIDVSVSDDDVRLVPHDTVELGHVRVDVRPHEPSRR